MTPFARRLSWIEQIGAAFAPMLYPGPREPVAGPIVTILKNIGWLLLAGAMVPVFMALTLGGALVIVGRHLYWWARGNTTATSRVPLSGPPPAP